MSCGDDERVDLSQVALDMMARESDRGCVLVGATVVDRVLESALRACLSSSRHAIKHAVDPLFAQMGPLATFSARTRLAYALGLIDETEFRDLQTIRKLRNALAHSQTFVHFEDDSVKAYTDRLQTGCDSIDELPRVDLDEEPPAPGPALDAFNDAHGLVDRAKARFTVCVAHIAGRLQHRAAHLSTRS